MVETMHWVEADGCQLFCKGNSWEFHQKEWPFGESGMCGAVVKLFLFWSVHNQLIKYRLIHYITS